MQILVLNFGGSSFKFLLEEEGKALAQGQVDRLGTPKAVLKADFIKEALGECSPKEALALVLDRLAAGGLLKQGALAAVAHKVAHGGAFFREAVVVDDKVKEAIRACIPLAPVHNPPALAGIELCQELFGDIKQVVAFETGFHQSLPEYAYTYGIPYEWQEEYAARKYGFHGTSHRYVSQEVATRLGKEGLRIISCHLGSGTSVAAIRGRESVDISSGLTPQAGTIMSTRPGDFDPWLFPYLGERLGSSPQELSEELIKKGGLLGISAVSGDMRDLEEADAAGNRRAKLAIDVFCYQVQKYIGAFAAALGGVDVLVFTGGIGEHGPLQREQICRGLEFLGIALDPQKNDTVEEGAIGAGPCQVLVIKCQEEIMVARQARELLQKARETNGIS